MQFDILRDGYTLARGGWLAMLVFVRSMAGFKVRKAP